MKQGQACDWMNLQARASDVNDTRCHDKVGVNRFQLPGQRTHAVGTEVLGVANSDHVGVSSPQRIYDGGLITKDRHRMSVDIDRVPPAGSPTRNTHSSDSIARASHPLELLGHGGGSVVRTDHEHGGDEAPFRPFLREPSAAIATA